MPSTSILFAGLTTLALTLATPVNLVPRATASASAFPTGTPIIGSCEPFPGSAQGSNLSYPVPIAIVNTTASTINNQHLLYLDYSGAEFARLTVNETPDVAGVNVRCNSGTTSPNGAPSIEVETGSNTFYPMQIFYPSAGGNVAGAGNAQVVWTADEDDAQLLQPFNVPGYDGVYFGGSDGSVTWAASLEYKITGAGASDLTYWRIRYVPVGGEQYVGANEQLALLKLDW